LISLLLDNLVLSFLAAIERKRSRQRSKGISRCFDGKKYKGLSSGSGSRRSFRVPPILKKELVGETIRQKYRTTAGSGRAAKSRGSQSSKKTKVAVKAIK